MEAVPTNDFNTAETETPKPPSTITRGWSRRTISLGMEPTSPMKNITASSFEECLNVSGCVSDYDRYKWRCHTVRYTPGLCEVFAESLTEEPIALHGDEGFWTKDVIGNDWIVIYKLHAGSSVDPYLSWISNQTIDGGSVNPLVTRNDSWDRITQIKVSMYTDDTEVMTTVFNATGSLRTNWLAQNRIISSPYDDIRNESQQCRDHPEVCFDVEGWAHYGRRFFAVYAMRGCSRDYVWFVVGHSVLNICSWINGPNPVIKYCPTKTVCNAYDLLPADTLVVYAKLN